MLPGTFVDFDAERRAALALRSTYTPMPQAFVRNLFASETSSSSRWERIKSDDRSALFTVSSWSIIKFGLTSAAVAVLWSLPSSAGEKSWRPRAVSFVISYCCEVKLKLERRG